MPYSLRFVLLLVAFSIVAAIASGAVIYGQDYAQARTAAEQLTLGHVDAGRVAIGRYGCGACHVIPGVSGAAGEVGPSLAKIATRTEIAGVLANDPHNMTRWLRHPQQIVPGNGMPDQKITGREARDIAAYLYTVRH
jgi:cytochrome c